MKLFLYFSEMIGMDVLDSRGEYLGGVHDLAMNPQGDIYPKATDLIIRRGNFNKEFARIPWDDLAYIENEARLKPEAKPVEFSCQPIKPDFAIRRDILDQQVVDTDNQKVVRVNDIHLLRVDNKLYVAHVDVGLRGLVRRLEWNTFIDFVVKKISPKAPYLSTEELIPWKNTQVLSSLGQKKSLLKLDVARSKLSGLPPAALADIMQDLDIFARISLFKTLDASLQLRVFTDLALTDKEELIDQLHESEVAAIIQNIPSDEAADLLMKLPRERAHQLMGLLGSEANKKLRKLLSFAQYTAGGLMTTEYLSLKPDATVADGIKKIKDNVNFPGSIFFLYIVDEQHKYLGTTNLRRFLNEDPNKKLLDTSYPDLAFVYTDDDMETVALMLERHKFSSIPVLNKEDILQGVITIDDVMEELISLVWSKYKEKL